MMKVRRMSSKEWKWILGILAFVFMWFGWGFNEAANIINNIGWFGMVAAFIAWTDSKKTRDEILDLHKRTHKLIEELHRHNVPKE